MANTDSDTALRQVARHALRLYRLLVGTLMFLFATACGSKPPLHLPATSVADGILVELNDSPGIDFNLADGVRREPYRRNLATRLQKFHYRSYAPQPPSSGVSLSDFVRVLAYDGDLSQTPAVKAIPSRHFHVDRDGKPVGLEGPRVRIDVPPFIALKVSGITLKRFDEVPNPIVLPAPDGDGGFVDRSDAASVAMYTAFVTATRVIDLVERWSGHRVEWGNDGQLTVSACTFAPEYALNYYDSKARTVYLGALRRPESGQTSRLSARHLVLEGALSPDIVAHEAAHAALDALKPGHRSGVAVALGEGIADAMSFLVSLDDLAVVDRILRQTGGNFREENELSRFREIGEDLRSHKDAIAASRNGEPFWRSMLNTIALADCGIERDRTELSPIALISPGKTDPHHIGQIISGSLYELFVSLYEKGVDGGVAAEGAIQEAADTVGVLMLSALRFVGENNVSLREYALALLYADSHAFDGVHRTILVEELTRRGLIDVGEDIDATIRTQRASAPNFAIEPGVTAPVEILSRVEELEARQLKAVQAIEWTMRSKRRAIPLIRHKASAFLTEEVKTE